MSQQDDVAYLVKDARLTNVWLVMLLCNVIILYASSFMDGKTINRLAERVEALEGQVKSQPAESPVPRSAP
jgi:hypothetical protein